MIPVDWSGEVFNAVVMSLLMGGEHEVLVGSLVVGSSIMACSSQFTL